MVFCLPPYVGGKTGFSKQSMASGPLRTDFRAAGDQLTAGYFALNFAGKPHGQCDISIRVARKSPSTSLSS
jgi:hypothetical protein